MAQSPSSDPGERRLDRPPSDRYRAATDAEDPASAVGVDLGGSPARAAAFGVLAAIGGALGFLILGGIALVTAGLLVWAAIAGWLVAFSVRRGAAASLDRKRRVAVSVVLGLVAVGLGQLGIWLFGRAEGGVLPLVDYLAEVFGFLVPLEFVLAAVVAWWTAR